MLKALCVQPCRFWHASGITQAAVSLTVQTMWNCKALHTLDLILLIVKCPFKIFKRLPVIRDTEELRIAVGELPSSGIPES